MRGFGGTSKKTKGDVGTERFKLTASVENGKTRFVIVDTENDSTVVEWFTDSDVAIMMHKLYNTPTVKLDAEGMLAW